MNDKHVSQASTARNEAVIANGESVSPHLGGREGGQPAARPGPDAPGTGAVAQQWPTDSPEPNKLRSRFPGHRGGRRRPPLWR